jgi:hypothetical protein
MNLTGELTHAGTMNVGTDKNLCGVFVRCAPYRLKDVKSLPMYREVTVIETAELDALRARCARLEAVIREAAERCLVEHPTNEHKSSSEAIIAVRRFLINGPADPDVFIKEGES